MRANADDLRQYVPDQDIPFELFLFDAGVGGGEVPQIPLVRDQSWYVELETCWSTIQLVADIFMSGVEVTPEAVKTLQRIRVQSRSDQACTATARRRCCLRHSSMPQWVGKCLAARYTDPTTPWKTSWRPTR